MKIEKALDIIAVNKENIENFTGGVKSFEKEFDEAIELVQKWQKEEELGEVNFDYYNETGKTITISIGFRNYWTTMNDFEEGFLFDEFESKEEYLDSEVNFEYITVMYEDEGDTEHDGFSLLIGDGEMEVGNNKVVIDFLKTTFKDFFEN